MIVIRRETLFNISGRLGEIDINKLDNLELSLNTAEETLATANIEMRYKELEELNKEMYFWLNDYTGQLRLLTEDVANIRDINATIPRDCFKKIVLEPTEKPKRYY